MHRLASPSSALSLLRPGCGSRPPGRPLRLNGPAGGSLEIVGLTSDGDLLLLRRRRSGSADQISFVTSLSTDTRLVGIDFRPATGELYGLGDAGGVYTLDLATARRRSSRN